MLRYSICLQPRDSEPIWISTHKPHDFLFAVIFHVLHLDYIYCVWARRICERLQVDKRLEPVSCIACAILFLNDFFFGYDCDVEEEYGFDVQQLLRGVNKFRKHSFPVSLPPLSIREFWKDYLLFTELYYRLPSAFNIPFLEEAFLVSFCEKYTPSDLFSQHRQCPRLPPPPHSQTVSPTKS